MFVVTLMGFIPRDGGRLGGLCYLEMVDYYIEK